MRSQAVTHARDSERGSRARGTLVTCPAAAPCTASDTPTLPRPWGSRACTRRSAHGMSLAGADLSVRRHPGVGWEDRGRKVDGGAMRCGSLLATGNRRSGRWPGDYVDAGCGARRHRGGSPLPCCDTLSVTANLFLDDEKDRPLAAAGRRPNRGVGPTQARLSPACASRLRTSVSRLAPSVVVSASWSPSLAPCAANRSRSIGGLLGNRAGDKGCRRRPWPPLGWRLDWAAARAVSVPSTRRSGRP